jgi:hypothetical protein
MSSDSDLGPKTSPPSSSGGFGRAGGGFAGFGPPPAMMPPSFPTMPGFPQCMQCGAFCSDCGSGCECSQGHTPFDPAVWSVPFAGAGDDGWRDSPSALCPGLESVTATHVWGDGRGVYMLAAGNANVLNPLHAADDDAGVAQDESLGSASTSRTRLFHNEGGGWTRRAELSGASMQARLSGIARGPLFVYGGPGEDQRACALGEVIGSEFDCKLVDTTIGGVAVVSPSLAYALEEANKLRVYDGSGWQLHPEALPRAANAIWADEHELVAVGFDGSVMRLRDERWTVENVGGIQRLTAVWGTSGDDLWVGTLSAELLHFDGSGWSKVGQLGGVTCSRREAIEHIWGAGSHVWVSTAAELARWDGSEMTTFGNWTCTSNTSADRISNVWGTAPDDVFIAVTGGNVQPPCGAAFVVHYDGELFHRF